MSIRKKTQERNKYICRDCAHVRIVTRFFTLSLEGKPLLGECPYEEYCVLLSQKSCNHFKQHGKT